MTVRILLGFLAGVFVLASPPSDAIGNQCPNSLTSKLRRVDVTLNSDIDRLAQVLSAIKTKEDLRLYLADPKVGGKDGRKDFFFLEAYGQVFRHYKKGEGIRKDFREIIDASFKVVEDRIGKYSEHVEVLEAARAYQLDPSLITFLEKKAEKAFDDLFLFMKNEGWIGDRLSKLAEVKDALAELEWSESDGRDHKLFFRSLRDMFEAYHEKMADEIRPLLEEQNWEYLKNMEDGLHEARRLLRWVMIVMQMRPEAFSYSKSLDPKKLSLRGPALEVARASLEDAFKRNSAMLNFSISKEGTAELTPETVFFISGLVDRLGALKKKSELYFKLQDEVRAFQRQGGSIPGVKTSASDVEIQKYIIASSANAGPGLNLQGIFTPGDRNPFQSIRQQTLDLLASFWKLESLIEFQEASATAKDYWDEHD